MKTHRHAKDDLTIFSRIRETRKKKADGLGYGLSWCKTRGRRRKEIQTMFIFVKVQKMRSLGVRFLSDMPLLVSEVEDSPALCATETTPEHLAIMLLFARVAHRRGQSGGAEPGNIPATRFAAQRPLEPKDTRPLSRPLRLLP